MTYENYEGRSIGRLLYFLSKYGPRVDTFIIGEGKVEKSHGELIGTYTWDDDTDIPTFVFINEYNHFNTMQDEIKSAIVEAKGFDTGYMKSYNVDGEKTKLPGMVETQARQDEKIPFLISEINMKKFRSNIREFENHIGFVKQMMNPGLVVNTTKQLLPHWEQIMKNIGEMDKSIKSIK